jgi:cysteine desulfurase
MLSRLDREGFAIASGSACASATPEASATLLAMDVAPELAHCAVRVSLGIENTFDEVARFLQALARSLGELKGLAAHAA